MVFDLLGPASSDLCSSSPSLSILTRTRPLGLILLHLFETGKMVLLLRKKSSWAMPLSMIDEKRWKRVESYVYTCDTYTQPGTGQGASGKSLSPEASVVSHPSHPILRSGVLTAESLRQAPH